MSTIDWLNTSGGNFATASDWNLDRVPLPSDDVEIDATGSYVVTSSASETIASLAIGSLAVLEVSGGNFTVSGAISVTYVIGVDPGAGLYVGGAVTGIATLDNLGGFMEFDSSVTSLIDFDTDQGGEALLAGSGSFTVMTAYNGGNAVVLDLSSAQSVVAGGGGAYDFYDEGSANDYIGNTGNMSVAKNLGSGADQFYLSAIRTSFSAAVPAAGLASAATITRWWAAPAPIGSARAAIATRWSPGREAQLSMPTAMAIICMLAAARIGRAYRQQQSDLRRPGADWMGRPETTMRSQPAPATRPCRRWQQQYAVGRWRRQRLDRGVRQRQLSVRRRRQRLSRRDRQQQRPKSQRSWHRYA